MVKYSCGNCQKIFDQKGHYEKHLQRKTPCKKDNTIEKLVEEKVKEVLSKTIESKFESNEDLLDKIIKNITVPELSEKLNLAVGTVRRWIELKNVPSQYRFDLLKLLSRDIDYSKYSSSLKDQFFTPSVIVEKCWNKFKELVESEEYTFIEPSAGDGSFLNILPPNTLAFDIEPRDSRIITQDYLSWKPLDLTKKYIVFGNPPFGLRGHLALEFINHSYEFADYVCFILPQLFESDGKGSPRKRVKGYNLLYSEKITGLFYTPENTNIEINGVFQIWSKYRDNEEYSIKSFPTDKIKIYSLSDGGTVSSTRNKNMINECDIYLPSTCFGKENMKIYSSFEDLPGRKGYGIVFLNDKLNMISKAKNIDWSSVSFLSTNSAYNLRTSLIYNNLSNE
jgi:hypothetical protein